MPLGRSLLLRPQFAGVLVPFIVIAVMAVGITTYVESRRSRAAHVVGRCVQMDLNEAGFGPAKFVSCNGPHNGYVTRILKGDADCLDGEALLDDGVTDNEYCTVYLGG